MTDPIDVAYVEIRADGSKFGPDVAANVDREMSRSGKAIKESIAKPLEDAAKQSQSIFSGIGQSISNGLRPGLTQVNNFRAGFNDSRAAASAFTGTMGTLGGQVRTTLNPAITAMQNFHAGFVSTDAAASAFTGRMGTLGGVVRSAINPAITSVQNFHSGLTSVDAATSAFSGRMGTLGGAVTSTFRFGQTAVTGFGTVVGSTFRGAQTVVRDFGSIGQQVASRIGTAFEGASERMQTRFSSAISSMRGVALTLGAALGVGGIGALIGSGISRLSDIEQTTKSLEVMTGSAAKAKDTMNALLTFAKSTPFAFPDVSEIGRNLVAFGIDTTRIVPILKSLGDAASASGQGVQGLRSLGDAMGNIALQGKISGEDLQSFAALGVPALTILANTAGTSAADMSKSISKGTVDSKFAIDALVNGIENGTRGIAGSTARMGGIMASQKDTIAGTMDSFKSSVTSTMATLLTPVIPLMRQGINAIGGEFKKLPALVNTIKSQLQSLGFIDAIKNMFAGIANIIAAVWPALQRFAQIFMTVFGAGVLATMRAFGVAFQWIGDHIRQFLPIIQPIATVLGAVWGATMLLRGALMLAGGAMLIWKGIMVVFGPIMKIFTALQWALNVAMNANPISLIVIAIAALVAAFVILWNKSAGFRLFWIGLWQAISGFFVGVWNTMKSVFTTVIDALKNAWNATWKFISDVISAVWTGFLKPVFDAIGTAVHAVGEAAQWLWLNILQPVFNFIGAAATIMGKIVLGLVLIPLVAFWRGVLAPTIQGVWMIIQAVFQGISNVISFAWTNVIKPIFDFIANVAIPAVVNSFQWLWHYGVENPWNMIKQIISNVWNNFIKPIFDFIGNVAIPAVVNAFQWLWHYGVENPWNMIKQIITNVWNTYIKPIFDFISNVAIPAVVNSFHWLWHYGVENPWNMIKQIISSVWDRIQPIFEAIKTGVGKVGDAFSNVKEFIGRVWGQLGDIAMKPIKFIVNTVLDDGLIAGWNKVVDFLKLGFLHIPPIPRLATGGIIPGYTPGRDTHLIGVGGGEAVMRPEWTRAAGADYVHGANAAARSGGVGGARAFIMKNGLPGFADGGIIGAIGNFFKNTWDGVVNFGGQVLNFLTDPIGGMQTLLNSVISGLGIGGLGDIGQLGGLITQAPKSLIDGMVQKIRDWWNSVGAASASTGAVNTSGIRGNNRSIVMQIFSSMFGWGDPANVAATDYLMMRESGYNNTAQNPHSTAYGMFQFLDSTWGGYGIPKTSDPGQQAVAGGRYIKSRYTNPLGAAAHERAFNWYRFGGIPKFDTGGWMMPGQLGYNGTSTPEPVLTSKQWDLVAQSIDVKSAAAEILAQLQRGGSIFEDFSFYGNSQNVRSNNDLLSRMFYGSGGQFNATQITQFLTSVTAASARSASAAQDVAATAQASNDVIATKLDEMITLLRQRQTLRATLSLDGRVLQQWFQETEIMGGL